MHPFSFLLFTCLFLASLLPPSLGGAGGAAQTATLSGIINHYGAVTAIDTCTGRLEVSDTAGFGAGTTVLLIQMQGALIAEENNAQYGTVLSLRSAGLYEQAVIDSVGSGALFLKNRLVNSYQVAGKVQVVSFPHYAQAVATDTLRARPWDGQTGGVLALDVADTLFLNAPASATGTGFRGGMGYVGPGNNCNWAVSQNDYFYPLGNWRAAPKGEGIAATGAGRELGRGRQGTGGGGGNDHNAGGGGGANVAPGGNGGDNDEPSTFGCDGHFPGRGGELALAAPDRLFLGGGGGAGHANNFPLNGGGAGGGIVLLRAGVLRGAQPFVYANGSGAGIANGDGGGGGGGGGTIWLDLGIPSPALSVQAGGGRGGNTSNNNGNRCFGPGGGGGGGRIFTNISGILAPPGGAPGVIANSTNSCNGSTSGAQAGQPGQVLPVPPLPEGTFGFEPPAVLAQPADTTVCPGQPASFTAAASPGLYQVQWQFHNGTGWVDIADTAAYTGFLSGQLTVLNPQSADDGRRFRWVVRWPGCAQAISEEAVLTVEADPPMAAFTVAVAGNQANFTDQSIGATAWFWDFGDGGSSQLANPQHAYAAAGTYTVTLYAIGPCDTATATQIVNLQFQTPVAGFSFPAAPSGCGSVEVAFQNQSSANATGFQWFFPGGSPSASTLTNPVVTYSSSGAFNVLLIATNAFGSDTVQNMVAVTILAAPVAAFTAAAQPGGAVQFTDQSTGATSWSWDFGDGATSVAADPLHAYSMESDYTVVLTVSGPCGTSSTQQTITVQLPPAAAFAVADTIYGCDAAVVGFTNLSSGNAGSFAWTFPGGDPPSSTLADPIVVYGAEGGYSAQLIAFNAVGADTAVHTFQVVFLEFPTADFSYQLLGNGLVAFTNLGQQGTDYTWDFGDGSPVVHTFQAEHQYTQSGVFTVTLTVANPCGAAVYQENLEVLVVATGEPPPGPLRIYPNPTGGPLWVEWPADREAPLEISLYDWSGRLLLSAPEGSLDLSTLPAGSYRLRIRWRTGTAVAQIVKHGTR